jgi:hypothetical protein
LRWKGGFPGLDEVEVKNVEAQANRAINDDCLLGVFAHLDIQRDDEHLSLRHWCPTSKPIFDLPRTINTSTKIISQIRRSKFLIADFICHRGGVYFEAGHNGSRHSGRADGMTSTSCISVYDQRFNARFGSTADK